MSLYKPRPWQPKITDGILNNKRINILANMGSGKSAATLAALRILFLFGEIRRVLIVGPKRVAQFTWPESLDTFRESFGHMTMATAVGAPEVRHAAVRGNAMIVTINFENLEWLIDNHDSFVLSTGGSISTEPATFDQLLSSCYTVWLKASPAEHMARVVAQGDRRPMGDNSEAMQDLERILVGREPMYRKADATVNTSGLDIESSLAEVLKHVSART